MFRGAHLATPLTKTLPKLAPKMPESQSAVDFYCIVVLWDCNSCCARDPASCSEIPLSTCLLHAAEVKHDPARSPLRNGEIGVSLAQCISSWHRQLQGQGWVFEIGWRRVL